MKLVLAIALVGVTSLNAAPIYVGENLETKNNATLGFGYTPTKKTNPASATDKTGTITALELKGAYNLTPESTVRASIPFYMADKNAAAASRNAMGNVSIGGLWSNTLTSSNQAWTYGYTLSADAYAPTSRKDEAGAVAFANPTTDLWKYTPRALALTPTLGGFLKKDQVSVKTNLAYNYAYIGKKSGSPSDQNRQAITWQLGTSWQALNNLSANLEYNTLYLDDATKTESGGTARFRHGITPSISGNYEALVASAYATIPLDKSSRDVTAVSIGANVGYQF